MVIRLADLRDPTSWFYIASGLRHGEYPEPKDLAAALRRLDKQVPAEVRTYLADLIEGRIDRRGRPATPIDEQICHAYRLAARVHELQRSYREKGDSAPKKRAFQTVAAEHGWTETSAKKNYFRAKKLLLI